MKGGRSCVEEIDYRGETGRGTIHGAAATGEILMDWMLFFIHFACVTGDGFVIRNMPPLPLGW